MGTLNGGGSVISRATISSFCCCCMIEAKAREYFQGACDHILAPATDVPETIWQVFSIELLAAWSWEWTQSLFWGFFRTYKVFLAPPPPLPWVRKRSNLQYVINLFLSFSLREAIRKEVHFFCPKGGGVGDQPESKRFVDPFAPILTLFRTLFQKFWGTFCLNNGIFWPKKVTSQLSKMCQYK